MNQEGASAADSGDRSSPSPASWRPRIMFIDDDESFLDGLRRVLRSKASKWDIQYCSASVDALRLLRKKHYDILVADLKMPGPSGLEIVRAQNAISPETNCIILSGYGDMKSVSEIINTCRVFRFLTKPCDPMTLIATLEILTEKLRGNRRQPAASGRQESSEH